jgi:hypothetical protein
MNGPGYPLASSEESLSNKIGGCAGWLTAPEVQFRRGFGRVNP